jgi:hypothetical protein
MTDRSDQTPSNLPSKPEVKTDGEKEAAPIDPEVLEKLPPDIRRAVESFSLQAFSGPVFNPILKKINESHIDKVLDQTEKDSDREFQDRQRGRAFGLMYGLIAAALFVFVTIYLAGLDKELYRDLLTKIIIFFGGSGVGYGVKAWRDRDD